MKQLPRFLALALLAGAAQNPATAETTKELHVETSEEVLAEWRAKIQDAVADIIPLDSEEGQKLLGEAKSPDYERLAGNWVPQLKSHCGAASAVVVQNAMLPGEEFTQSGLFTPETAHIITQDVVYRIGFTLEELDNMIETRSGLKTTRFHAGEEEWMYSYEDWLAALKQNQATPGNNLIINYPTEYVIDRQNKGGHFSPIAAYHEEKNLVLILEISPRKESYWIDAHEIWGAMNQVDPISEKVRGWIVVESGNSD